jgi:hypothetical protein
MAAEDEGGLIRVIALRVGPSQCPIAEPLEIALDYELAEAVTGARWHISYLVDSVRRRHLVELGAAGATSEDLPPGTPLSLRFRSGAIDVGHLKPSQLCNAGLLILTLRGRTAAGGSSESKEAADGGKEDAAADEDGLGAVQLVVQAMPAVAGGFVRSILNPWE